MFNGYPIAIRVHQCIACKLALPVWSIYTEDRYTKTDAASTSRDITRSSWYNDGGSVNY